MLLGLALTTAGWVALSIVLFVVSQESAQASYPASVRAELDPGGFPLTSSTDILVLGSDQRPVGSREPGASTSGPSRSDTIMLIRVGGGRSARLSIPRDTIVDLPGYGVQKINAAYYFGGPALAIATVKRLLGVPINHLVEIDFAGFPKLIDDLGGITYTGGCVVTYPGDGFAQGGFTLRLPAGTHHLDGEQALALARTRHNLCNPAETDLTREERQQKILTAMLHQLTSPHAFFHLPWVSWDAPGAFRTDMSGPTLLAVAAAMAVAGTPPTRLLEPTGQVVIPGVGDGLTVDEAEIHRAVAQFLAG